MSHQTSVQPSTKSLSFSGAQKPKQVFQISSGTQINNTSNSISFAGKPREKQVFQIVSNNNVNSSSSQGLSFAGKPKPIYQISSNHQGNNTSSSGQGISFIAPEKPKYVPVSNGISFEGNNPDIKRSNPNEYKISSSNQNTSNVGTGISYIAPERKKEIYSVSNGISFASQSKNGSISQGSQGISYIAPDPPKRTKNNIQFSGSQSVSIQFSGTGNPPPTKKKKKKHYDMTWDSKYKKSNPKEYKIVRKQINLFFEGKKPSLEYIIQQLSQPSQVPNMSVKSFFSKKGRRRGGRK
jgi:hypothetical protein